MIEATRHRPYRLAALVSHPIQYLAPLYRVLAERREIDLHVYFGCAWGTRVYRDPGFGVRFAWDVPLLNGYPHTFLRNLHPWPNPNRFLGLINPGVLSALRRGRYDAVWVHGWFPASTWLAWAGAQARGIPILLRAEASGLTEPAGLKRAVKQVILRTLFSQIDGFLAIGASNANFYRTYEIREDRIFMSPYSVDNEFFIGRARELRGQKRSLRAQEGLPPDLPVVLFCGKFYDVKRPLDVLRAFRQLDGTPPASLALVGDGPLRGELEEYARREKLSSVHFLGFRNQARLPECYALADCLVLPSASETWGIVLNEAMCFGLPVIATDRVGGAADLIREGEDGFTYPVGDVGVLADRLREILRDEDRREAMGQRSLEIIGHWGPKESADGIVNALEQVVR